MIEKRRYVFPVRAVQWELNGYWIKLYDDESAFIGRGTLVTCYSVLSIFCHDLKLIAGWNEQESENGL